MDIFIKQGDITTFQGNRRAIVNAANPRMLGGGGVDGAIHRAAGPQFKQACVYVPPLDMGLDIMDAQTTVRCLPGMVRPTPGFGLGVPWVFHTVGPIWDPGRAARQMFGEEASGSEEDRQRVLAKCFKTSILMAGLMDLDAIAFPAISTGVYGCPFRTCATIALGVCDGLLELPVDVHFYIFEDEQLGVWLEAARYFDLDINEG